MKYIYFSVFVILLNNSCKKEREGLPIDPYVGIGSVLINGDQWTAEASTYSHPFNKDSISINFVRKDSDGIIRELLSFAYLPIEVNQYGLSVFEITDLSQISATYTTYIADGDVTGEFYSVNQELSTNFIEIQKIDSTTMDIEGRFEVLLTIYPPHGKTFPSSPDTLHFTDGFFKVRVKP